MSDPGVRGLLQSSGLTVSALVVCGKGHDWALVEIEFGLNGSVRRYECRCGAINYDLCT